MELNPLYRLYVQLNDKVDKLSQNTTISANTDVSDLVVRLRALENKPSLDNDIAKLKGVIENLENNNNEIKDRINYLSKIDNLENRIYNIEIEPKFNEELFNTRITNLENNNYIERFTNIVNRLNNIEQLVNSITDLSYRIGELEKKQDLTERVNALESIVANLKN
jgi:phage shock protein A